MSMDMPNGTDLCMGCMNPLPEGRQECGICGYPVAGENPPLYLPVRTKLSDRYLVGRVLAGTGDAAMYLGFDLVLKSPILIREFLPDTLCERGEDKAVRIIGGCESTYSDYLTRFRNHARALARMRDLSGIVPVYDIFEQNGTAYTVSEYCEGITLETRLAQMGGRMRWEEARPLFMPLMSTLGSLHAAGLTHLGISPDNLTIGTDGRLRLCGFVLPEARVVSTDLKPQLLAGYAAPEQYGFDQPTGAMTDVYGLAATLFRTLTGNPPPDGTSRAKNSSDLFVPADVAKDLPDTVAAALFNALQVLPEKRTQTIAEFRDQLTAAPAVEALISDVPIPEEATASPEEEEPPAKKNANRKYAALIVLSVFIVLALIAAVALMLMNPQWFGGGKTPSSDASGLPTLSSEISGTVPSYVAPTKQFIVPNLVGRQYTDVKDTTKVGNIQVEVTYEFLKYSDRPKGEIVSQTPAAKESVDEGTVVKVVLSAGPETVALPNLVGWPEQYARTLLELQGFKVETVKVLVSDYERGLVDSVDVPDTNAVKQGDTITLKVSDQEPQPTETTADPYAW